MSMLHYPLYNFLATVPKCGETSALVAVLELFEQEQCDRLIVVNQQQMPIGLLNSARFTQQLLAQSKEEQYLQLLQQPLTIWQQSIFEPIQILAAGDRVEQFVQYLQYQPTQTHNSLNWVLINPAGKFLGMLDSSRLLRLLVQEKVGITAAGRKYSDSAEKTHHRIENHESRLKTRWRPRTPQRQSRVNKPLIQLLERLPWPLMLQTSTGEIVTQNPAWWEQLGVLKDPEGVREQVAAILSPLVTKQPEYAQTATKVQHSDDESTSSLKLHSVENTWAIRHEALPHNGLLPFSPNTAANFNHLNEPLINPAINTNRCFLDIQMGTCTCVVEEQNGQERVWQFAKIPLDSPEFKLIDAQHTQDSPINADNLWLVLATDVTEQQQLCKELAAKNADLIQLNRLKDEFLACISHELKTPLTAVLGLSRLLVDKQLGELNERQARYAGLIHQSGRHLMSVVNDILDLTRMETGQMELALAPVNIRAVCDRALAEAKAIQAQSSKNLSNSQTPATVASTPQFTLTIEPGIEQMVADELRLRQMLVHLLSNAFKFTEISGEIGLRVNHWEGWIAFTIWDTGIGIPEHQQHLIFQKFQQLENPLTRQFEGTGLGLVLTRALARLHGGDVSFLSQEGKGSQFTLLLPPTPPATGFADTESNQEDGKDQGMQKIATSVRPQAATPTQHHTDYSQRLVLVVEAVARYIEDLTEQLKGLGYRVVIARSGTEAVEKARRLQPKAIFLNPLLPLLSGWDVLTLVKSDVATRHIPVVVTATGAEKDQAFANQADGFLSLPVENQSLAPLLDKLCAEPKILESEVETQPTTAKNQPLRILRLVNPELVTINPHPSLREHRVIEVDNLDQAELLARVWQFDVMLLDVDSAIAPAYLQQLIKHPRLVALPLVTCDVATSLAASQIPSLSVFPCLTPLGNNQTSRGDKTDPLLSVLQIASGICCPPSILVVDLATLHDLPQIKRKQVRNYRKNQNSPLINAAKRGSEWFQALIQYLQTAGLKAAIGRSWTEVNQQIRYKSVDLLLICLGESPLHPEVLKVLQGLEDLPLKPPILVLDQRASNPDDVLGEIQPAIRAIASEILPRSISMEDLLTHINQALFYNQVEKC
ncbi:hybrid sensor histidine kinase/response regulator [Nostoc sp. FACHB-110]|uniref:ATP-binding response regulator n=1 Tax=Nostoc sp. FACHB-110 TaxID=2692834 RepID=UPI001685A3D8|nr:hybrid sensor histidine kinase/response regulator [Nostoc sp. FACHB-110]MBD2435712.1 hybrid sensor histidine kinase/response regulator [Nostoc sp. FACHB-110]